MFSSEMECLNQKNLKWNATSKRSSFMSTTDSIEYIWQHLKTREIQTKDEKFKPQLMY